MTPKTRPSTHMAGSTCPSRPVRIPRDREARLSLARDLCRGLWGVDEKRAYRIAYLPLMDVALDGPLGMEIAAARDWRRVA